MTSWDGGTLDEREYLIVRGTVQQIVYYNDENGYAVLRLAAENGAEVTATGTFPNIGLGEEVILTGCWVTHPTYGEQFATEAFERRLPTSVRGIAEYLGSGLIRGIGPRLAAKIAEKFGEDTFDILMSCRAAMYLAMFCPCPLPISTNVISRPGKYCRRTRNAARIRCSLTASQPSPYSVSSAEPCSRSSRAETISYTVCSTV